MSLAEFIRANAEQILSEWERYARARAPEGAVYDGSIRDHADAMLRAIAEELAQPEPEAKTGAAGAEAEAAAEQHGAGRAEYGFTLEQMVSEFGGLRDIVLRRWRSDASEVTVADFSDLRRFDAAIDRTLIASVSRYMKELDRAKETFLGILGHDLKTPLSAITMSAQLLLDSAELGEGSRKLATQIERAGKRMTSMVSDLLDFTRSQLGKGIPIEPAETDLSSVIRDTVAEVKASNPNRQIDVTCDGALTGDWDAKRIGQALSNIIANAVHHGGQSEPVRVSARGEPDSISIAVHNDGEAIPEEKVDELFEPMRRAQPKGEKPNDSEHLGLGLHIAKAIATAHGGRIDVDSSAQAGTTFTLHIPRER